MEEGRRKWKVGRGKRLNERGKMEEQKEGGSIL